MFNGPESTPSSPAQFDAFLARVKRMMSAYEAQSETLQRLKAELESAQQSNEKLAAQLEAIQPLGQGRLQLDAVEDSKPTHLPQTHQSAPPSIDPETVQALLTEIESCIALLES